MDNQQLREKLLNLKNEAIALIQDAKSEAELERLRVVYLGRKGKINKFVGNIKKGDESQKREFGTLLNDAKIAVQEALESKTKNPLASSEDWIDVTLPAKRPPLGHLHPVTQAIDEITKIFERIGFVRARYPEVDYDYYVFSALNMPANHPARDEWETFFIKSPKHPKYGGLVLTTHTSNGQVREMERVGKPPIRMLNIAKCYRRQQDATHTSMFHQFEILVIDENITIQHLKGTLDYFAREFYGKEISARLRPFHFQFTEPSFEVDFTCTICQGKGQLDTGERCRFCKSGWLEVGGAGMVHPAVLQAGGIDPKMYTGFAFGMGVERAYRLKPGLKLDDIRLLYSNNLEFLEQF